MSLKPKNVAAACQQRLLERTVQLNSTKIGLAKQSKLFETQTQQLRNVSADLIHAQDQERRRIARELHDSLGQGLALLCFDLSKLRADAEHHDPALAEGISAKVKEVKALAEEVRTISYLLHPPLLDEMGLECALRWFVQGFQQRSRLRIDLQLPAKPKRLPRDVETAVFRIVQECLTNIYRHAESRTAFVHLSWRTPKELCLTVRDEGKGMSRQKLREISGHASCGIGFRGIEERIKLYGGTLDVSPASPGTLVRISIPLI